MRTLDKVRMTREMTNKDRWIQRRNRMASVEGEQDEKAESPQHCVFSLSFFIIIIISSFLLLYFCVHADIMLFI